MACVVQAGTLVGVDGCPVLVEVDLLRRLPSVVIVGLPSGAVRESADRVRSALQQGGFDFPRKRVVVNLAPADLRKEGTAFDLPIAVAILAASEQVPADGLDGTLFVGELSLDGELRRVNGALSLALMAAREGHAAVVERLLQHEGVDVNMAHEDGCTPLWIAAQEGHADVVAQLLRHAHIDVNRSHDDDHVSPLWIAAAKGRAWTSRSSWSAARSWRGSMRKATWRCACPSRNESWHCSRCRHPTRAECPP